jgi:hypothetical protein
MDKYHLTKKDDLWKLTKQGNDRASKTFDTKEEAIKESANFLKSNNGGSLKIHTQKGKLQEERTYPKSKDPQKTKG